MRLLLPLLLVALVACGHHATVRCRPQYGVVSQSAYDVRPNATTPHGIAVDTSGLAINLARIDRLTDELEACLVAQFGNPPRIALSDALPGECMDPYFDLPVKRGCIVVKIAADWRESRYAYAGSKQQLLPWTNGGGCTDKGMPPGVCWYRVTVQDDLTVVVPPSMLMLKEGLLRITTNCHNPWRSPALAACMLSTDDPMGDGSAP